MSSQDRAWGRRWADRGSKSYEPAVLLGGLIGCILTVAVGIGWHKSNKSLATTVRRAPIDPSDDRDLRALIDRFMSVEPTGMADKLHAWCLRAATDGEAGKMSVLLEIEPFFSSRRFAEMHPSAPPFIFESARGLSVRSKPRSESQRASSFFEAHIDQFLASCAEIGVPLTQPIETPTDKGSLKGLLEASRKRFVLDQELEWSVVAYCRYLPDAPTWKNRFGETQSYEQIAASLVSRPLEEGSCCGTHKAYSLAVMLGADSHCRFLSAGVRDAVCRYLRLSSRALVFNQLPDGAWGSSWSGHLSEDARSRFEAKEDREAIAALVGTTGHHLEWIAIVQPELRLPDETLRRAARFVATALRYQGPEEFGLNICGFSHALRALSRLAIHPSVKVQSEE